MDEVYPSKHMAEVRIHWSETRVPSQLWTPSRIRAASQGQSPCDAGSSVWSLAGRSGCV